MAGTRERDLPQADGRQVRLVSTSRMSRIANTSHRQIMPVQRRTRRFRSGSQGLKGSIRSKGFQRHSRSSPEMFTLKCYRKTRSSPVRGACGDRCYPLPAG